MGKLGRNTTRSYVSQEAALLLFSGVPVAARLGRLTYDHLLAIALGAVTASVIFQTAYQVYLLWSLSATR
jgi:hypothetical protein